MIPLVWCICECLPYPGRRVIFVQPCNRAARVTVRISADDVNFVIVGNGTCRAAQAFIWNATMSFPDIRFKVKTIYVRYGGFVGKAAGECTNYV